MPKMHCKGDLAEIPENGSICPKLPTNFVPVGTRCEVTCSSGSPSVTSLKCDEEGWKPSNKVSCSGSSAGLIVGLLVGGIILLVVVSYGYARYNKAKKQKALNNGKKKPPSSVNRATKIAEENDMIATGNTQVPQTHEPAPRMKIVSGDEPEVYHESPRNSSIPSNPPSYNTYMEEHNREHEGHKLRHSRKSNNSRDRERNLSSGRNSGYYNGGYGDQQHSYSPEYPGYYDNGHDVYPAEYNQQHGYYEEDRGYPADMYQQSHRGHGQRSHRKPYDVPI